MWTEPGEYGYATAMQPKTDIYGIDQMMQQSRIRKIVLFGDKEQNSLTNL